MTEYELIRELVRRRKELKLTQQELADQTAISRRTIANLEAGHIDISFFRLIRILYALNLHITFSPRTGLLTESELYDYFKEIN